ncbi:hypothetical protein [Methylomonas sp. AM2-LC]|uniref:hypothetical protein n=1 Tax=Methylomonas sp. AM2-LC TaxID=3153301 RepID=UPI003267A217
MKKLSQFIMFLSLVSVTFLANANPAPLPSPGGVSVAPEMDANFAIIGLGLLSGVIALVAERRRGK